MSALSTVENVRDSSTLVRVYPVLKFNRRGTVEPCLYEH